MDAKHPSSARLSARVMGDGDRPARMAETPMPAKNRIIIGRRPQRSPPCPAGKDPSPKKKKAATP